ncbi:MAG: nitrogenase [Clostridia bacterium]|nr:nitrogenase [Clostridia bacterium]
MAHDIAVYINEIGETTSLNEKGKVVIYQKRQTQWKLLKEKHFNLEPNLGLKELRQKMDEVIIFLEDCKIFTGLSVVGVPYFALEKAGCSIWEFAGKPREFLDYILEQEEEARLQEENLKENNLVPLPIDTGNGCYKISLKDIQQSNSGVTSKQVLIPFIRKGKFYSLEVVCSHVPPWLESELASGNLTGEIEKLGNNEVRVMISKKCCHEC